MHIDVRGSRNRYTPRNPVPVVQAEMLLEAFRYSVRSVTVLVYRNPYTRTCRVRIRHLLTIFNLVSLLDSAKKSYSCNRVMNPHPLG